ncbi:MAG: thiamine pyrophosphate-binding protein [Lentisphaeria bacterium]|nr:thiamine pyrophosphate-binding protein [Lentisphaeria bacterium]
MRVADYVFGFLADRGVKHVFVVTGGGAMFLNDALGREKRIRYVCNLHEQACAMAAEGYARVSGMPGVVSVTTGPGGTNALTGVVGAWLDSVPMLVISGQVKTSTTISACPELKLRQLGDQELNIVDVVRPVTKYAKMIGSASEIAAELEKAWRLCSHGRPGPVWLDIPLNIQAAEMPPVSLPETPELPLPQVSDAQIRKLAAKLKKAERPVLLAGGGIRNAGMADTFLTIAEKWNIPILTGISGIDLIPSDHRLFFGRPGILGERAANFILQNADLLLVVGSRMGIRQIGYAFGTTAARACKVMVDADEAELKKPTFRPDVRIHSDAGIFLRQLSRELPELPPRRAWLDYCRKVRRRFPVILPEHRARKDYVSGYVLPEILSQCCRRNTVVVTGNGCAYTSTFQAIPVKKGMRVFANQGCASMGYGLPAAVGAAFAAGKRPVCCITGDGSIQMNLQELQTVVNYGLPIKIFVYNNNGYLSIKLTQKNYFQGKFMGSEPSSGVTLPSLQKIAAAYGIPYHRLRTNREAERKMPAILAASGYALIEVMTDPFEELGPKAASRQQPDGSIVSAPLEDLFPFLDRSEFESWMIE